MRGERGQAALLILGGLCGLLIGAFVLGAVARGIGGRSDAQRSADLAALAGARAMLDAHPRLFSVGPTQLSKAGYLELGEAAAREVASRNGESTVAVSFPDADEMAPIRIRVEVRREIAVERGEARASTEVLASAEAELSASALYATGATGGEYAGPFAERQGQKMRPDVAEAFDRLAAAAAADGVTLLISSAWRSDAEQAILWAQNPDPRWVAPPGTSLHRLGTELDIGPATAYDWLAANAPSQGWILRYPWEPWHWGWARNPSSMSLTRDGRSALPSFVPAEYAEEIAGSAQRWNVSANLLASQLYVESGFNPFAVSGAGAQGIAQFMPATAAGMGLADPFDAPAAIDAQGHLMHDLLSQFASVPLALAAYNAGPVPVAACMCVPPYPETQAYVTQILGLMGGAGDLAGAGLSVKLVK